MSMGATMETLATEPPHLVTVGKLTQHVGTKHSSVSVAVLTSLRRFCVASTPAVHTRSCFARLAGRLTQKGGMAPSDV